MLLAQWVAGQQGRHRDFNSNLVIGPFALLTMMQKRFFSDFKKRFRSLVLSPDPDQDSRNLLRAAPLLNTDSFCPAQVQLGVRSGIGLCFLCQKRVSLDQKEPSEVMADSGNYNLRSVGQMQPDKH